VKLAMQWLELSVSWRFASLLFQSPTADARSELGCLARELPSQWQPSAHELCMFPLDQWEVEYHRILGPGGCPAAESSYDDNALAGRGPLLARVSGFYKAFAYKADSSIPEVPDHLSIELGFLSYLSMKAAFAAHQQQSDQLAVTRDAYERFLQEHLLFWLERFAESVDRSGSPFYIGAVMFVRRVCEAAMVAPGPPPEAVA
jgi:TorA maturation chaperone TorD